jgi:hypothetical protein
MDALHAALEKLARNDRDALNSYFHEIETHSLVEGTSAKCHFHCVNLDGSGRPKIDSLIQYLMANIIDYAIPRKKINAAFLEQQQSGSSVKMA